MLRARTTMPKRATMPKRTMMTRTIKLTKKTAKVVTPMRARTTKVKRAKTIKVKPPIRVLVQAKMPVRIARQRSQELVELLFDGADCEGGLDSTPARLENVYDN